MSYVAKSFSEGFVGAFTLAHAIVVGAWRGGYRFFARLGDRFVRHEPLR